MYKCWGGFVLYYFVSFVATQPETGRAGNRWHTDSRVGDRYAGTDWQRQGVSELPSPTNVTFSWTNEFCWELSWSLPENVDSQRCKYHINMSQIGQKNIIKTKKETRLKDCFPLMGVVRFSIQTQCNNRTRMSQTVVHTIPAPTELVKNFKCFLYSKAMNCSWLLTNQVPEDLQLYYGFKNMSKVSECSEYLYNDNQRTGCHLIGDFRIRIFFQVNGTLNGSSVRNTFEVDPKGHVQPLPLELKITEEGSNLNISWISPDIRDPRCWEYIINYTRCNTPESKSLKGETWIMVNYDPHCQYRVRIKPIFLKWCGMGEGDWTREEIYGKDGNRDWHLHVAAIFISVMAVIVSIVVCFCIRKHKDKILPQVPKPTNLISDMFNNNNDMSINEHLYIPAQEEVDCKITLVQDPLPQQPES
ncbi:interleukin-5 receptor subunit alpha isoform X1 [Salmo salar]|uniref:Interleukin-5 receptor subunit alpha isoform X1 n=1 Tax=Salmo salar TaxID=8030 RepID=A0ABM3DEX3_SALSA|nr:interleukin-5 receptor subunit alpha isoform X1 [Salmo salar]|eukprot:XP_014011458.1 PREDICTED: interleukin-5 receptor subunit alpha-like isoform X1 [Salmo salar]